MALAALWLAGRLAVAGLPPLPASAVMGIDCAFLLAIAVQAAVEIVAGRKWRNLIVVVPVLLQVAANATFRVEAMRWDLSDAGRRLGLSVTVFLIVLIGWRIVPRFTRNWLVRRQAETLPAAFGRFDAICLVATALTLLAWTLRPVSGPTALLLAGVGLLLLAHLGRWQGLAAWRSPLLLMLHVAYAFVPAGLIAIAAAAAGLAGPAAGLHLLGIGAVGGMTVAVMIRATLGHTGRRLIAGKWLAAAFALIVAAALVHAAGPQVAGLDGIAVAALLWTLGYGMIAVQLAPLLILPDPTPQKPERSVSFMEKVSKDVRTRLSDESASLMSRSSEANLTMTGAGR